MILVFILLTSVSMIMSRSIHVAANGIISFFKYHESESVSCSVMSELNWVSVNSLQTHGL